MPIHLYNTRTRTVEVFQPADPARVTMYLCGPTVYSYVHVGNARGPVVFDVLVRLLRRHFNSVIFARNITDVDDKINAAAHEQSVAIDVITDKYTRIYHDDMARLGVMPPDVEPHATGHIEAIIDMITTLIDGGHAYAAAGHVLFDVTSYAAYGSLSGRSLDEMEAGARIDVAPYKKNPADFVLWKPSDASQPGWNSPWGRGRPGWHIECSAMSAAHLGRTIDIHAGGNDLLFPHHENEVAQSTCAHGGALFARFWLHNGMLTFSGRKMSKSLGNVLKLHTLLDEHPPEALRLLLLRAHYRQPLDWSDEVIAQAIATLDGWYRVLRDVADVPIDAARGSVPAGIEAALCDDLNTPQALSQLAELADRCRQSGRAADKAALLAGGAALGLLQADPAEWFHGGTEEGIDSARIDSLLVERQHARAARDFARADAIRDELTAMGVEIEDGAEGTRWRMARR